MRAQPSRFDQFQQLHAFVCRAVAGANGAEREHLESLRSFVFGVAQEDKERERLALVFRPVAPEFPKPSPACAREDQVLWEIGEFGDTRLVKATSMGVLAAYRAMLGERPPGDKATAHAVKVTAVTWAERAGCPRLAASMRRIAVRAGRLEYLPGARPPPLVLR
jgi:hypothetical protein